ncbi:uncharacterized protein LOC135393943 [Ornithodoros turicata]|uniref:uncharacterized protein LOC135393943 n=1 Tax=Ornithodoros turicata TaxID=34597 RepID=UPI003138F3F7
MPMPDPPASMPLLRSGTDTSAAATAAAQIAQRSTTEALGGPEDSIRLRFPPFWTQDSVLWFAQIERQFDARRVTSHAARFGHVVSALPMDATAEIRDIILRPPAEAPYDTLKRELLARTLSTHRRLQQLLSAEELGDQKPSQLLRRMGHLTGDTPLDSTILQELFLHRLPSDIRVVLTAAGEMTMGDMALLADRILDLRSDSVASVTRSG